MLKFRTLHHLRINAIREGVDNRHRPFDHLICLEKWFGVAGRHIDFFPTVAFKSGKGGEGGVAPERPPLPPLPPFSGRFESVPTPLSPHLPRSATTATN
jgi:hypothetical protein